MTEHGASIFVFFFLGEYSSLILMSSFMSIFFLGGHHCPDIHKLILDPFIFLFYLLEYQFSYYFPLTGYFPIKHDNIQPVNDYFINLINKNTILYSFIFFINKKKIFFIKNVVSLSLVSLSKTYYIGIKIDVQIVWLKYMCRYIDIFYSFFLCQSSGPQHIVLGSDDY